MYLSEAAPTHKALVRLQQPDHVIAGAQLGTVGVGRVDLPHTALASVALAGRSLAPVAHGCAAAAPPRPRGLLRHARRKAVHAQQLHLRQFRQYRLTVHADAAVVLVAVPRRGPQGAPPLPQDDRPPEAPQVGPPTGVPQLLHRDLRAAVGASAAPFHRGRMVPAVPGLRRVRRAQDAQLVGVVRVRLDEGMPPAAGGPYLALAAALEQEVPEQIVDLLHLLRRRLRRQPHQLGGPLLFVEHGAHQKSVRSSTTALCSCGTGASCAATSCSLMTMVSFMVTTQPGKKNAAARL